MQICNFIPIKKGCENSDKSYIPDAAGERDSPNENSLPQKTVELHKQRTKNETTCPKFKV